MGKTTAPTGILGGTGGGGTHAWGSRSESLSQSDPDLWARLVEVGLVEPPGSGLPEGTGLFCHLPSPALT